MSREPGNCEFSRKQILGSFTVARLIPPVVIIVGCEVQPKSRGICELRLGRDCEESASVSQLFRGVDFAA